MGGGLFGAGTIFRLNTNGTGYTVLTHVPGGASGWAIEGSLLMTDTAFYSTTVRGGAWDAGVLFRVNTDGSGYTVLKSFGDGAGGWPEGYLASDGAALYGTTTGNMGTVYRIGLDGSNCTVLKRFTGPEGDTPFSGVVLSGSTLFGTAYWGGLDRNGEYSGSGTLYALNTDGSNWRVLKVLQSPGWHRAAGKRNRVGIQALWSGALWRRSWGRNGVPNQCR